MGEYPNFTSDPRGASQRNKKTSSPAPAHSATAPAGFQEARWLFVGGGIASAALTSFIAVYQWLPALVPLGLALCLAVVLSAVVGFLYCDREPARAFLMGFGLWALIVLPTGLWALAPVRAATADFLGHHMSEFAQVAALRDPAPQVQQRACVALGTDNQGVLAYEIIDSLFRAPLQGAHCIREVAAVDPAGASRLVSAFMARWEHAVKTSNAAQVCAVAPHAPAIAPAKIALPMTQCAVTSADTAMAQCCGEALATHYKSPAEYVDALGPVDDLTLPARQQLFTALLPYAFAQIDAARTPLPQLEVRLLRHDPVPAWVLALGCDTLFEAPNAAPVTAALEAVAQSQRCEAGRAGERRQWPQICQMWAAPAQRDTNLCAPIDAQRHQYAFGEASALVQEAIKAPQRARLGESIHVGAAQLAADPAARPSRATAGFFAEQRRLPGLSNRGSFAFQRRFVASMRKHEKSFEEWTQIEDEDE